MQDQHPYKMTPEQGWARMQPILDQVMPVPQRSRRLILFWWSVAAILATVIIGTSTWMYNQHKDHSASTTAATSPVKEQVADPVLENSSAIGSSDEVPATSLELQRNSTSVENEKDHTGNETDKKTSGEVQSQSTSALPTKATVKPGLKQNITPATKTQKPDMAAVTSKQNVVTEVPGSENVLVRNTTTGKTNEEVIASATPDANAEITILNSIDPRATNDQLVRATNSVMELPLADVAIGEDRMIAMDIEPQIHVFKNNKNKVAFITPHLGVSGFAGTEKGLGGNISAGLDFTIAPSFSLTTDLGYAIYKPEDNLFPSERELDANTLIRDDLEYLGFGDYVDAESVRLNSNVNLITPLVETLSQFEISAGVKWDVTRKFFIESGAMVGFGLSTTARYPVISYDPYNIPSTGSFYEVDKSLDEFGVVRSSTLSLYGGVGFRPLRKWEVYANYQHGLDPYLQPAVSLASNTDSRSDYIRGLNVGVRYHL